eukprot:TRINITY_DN14384_c0_g2_i1.p2 TRINITY_DN14384_c0_g2~~TRINITY_DN14384_c0_g2_i1.p2  ORF type:complete len:123 (+),score=38.69 TRINITY_DN14384_c0_g2_i1:47-415(+)
MEALREFADAVRGEVRAARHVCEADVRQLRGSHDALRGNVHKAMEQFREEVLLGPATLAREAAAALQVHQENMNLLEGALRHDHGELLGAVKHVQTKQRTAAAALAQLELRMETCEGWQPGG